VDANCTRHTAGCEELKIIDHRGVLYIKLRSVAFDLKGIVWDLHDPK
jgi:hypothetical protein